MLADHAAMSHPAVETPRMRSASYRVIAKLPERGRSAGPIHGYGRWCPGDAVAFEGSMDRTMRKRRSVTKITLRRSRRCYGRGFRHVPLAGPFAMRPGLPG